LTCENNLSVDFIITKTCRYVWVPSLVCLGDISSSFLGYDIIGSENDTIYYDRCDYENAPAAYNSGRRKRAYQYAAFVLWEGINYRRPHYTCVENGVRSLFPPIDGRVMGYKSD
jgi:hypothetical protein